MKQPQVARLELGEVNPSMDPDAGLIAARDRITIDVRPAGAPVRNMTKRAQAEGLVGAFRSDEAAARRRAVGAHLWLTPEAVTPPA